MVELITAVVLLSTGADISQSERAFEALGFETEPVIGGSLLISGSVALFEEKFGVTVLSDDRGQHLEGDQESTRVFARETFPQEIRGLTDAIEFEAPQDFGPSDY
jgi:hypothetical protein